MTFTRLSELFSMNESQVESQVDTLQEGQARYDGSDEFTEELFKVGSLIAEIKKITSMARWSDWMKTTDYNFSTDVASKNTRMIATLRQLDSQFRELEKELHNADGTDGADDDPDEAPADGDESIDDLK